MLRSVRIALLVALLWVLSGCGSPTFDPPSLQNSKINLLAAQLSSLDKGVDRGEAYDLSLSATHYTRHLADQYNLVTPPHFHNFLVNNGVRKRGLCYQWSGDLFEHLRHKKYKTLCFYHAGSDIGSYLYEHNALVVVAKGQPFEKGIILDGWRNSGNLYFIKVKEDKKYQWSQRGYRCTGVFYRD